MSSRFTTSMTIEEVLQATLFLGNELQSFNELKERLKETDLYYSLSKATPTTLGGIKIGTGLSIDADGLVSVNIDGFVPATELPLAAGTAAKGSSTKYAREDHVHPLQTTVSGNAGTATQFASAQSVTLTGDVTGTASSQAGWNVATTLSNSGVVAGSYGPSSNTTPGYSGTFNVPYFTVDTKGRVTAASTKTITLPAPSGDGSTYQLAATNANNAPTNALDLTGNTNTYLSLVKYNNLNVPSVVTSLRIEGRGATTVATMNGLIIITSTDTTYSNFVKSGYGAKAGLVPAPPTSSGTTRYLREDGKWIVPPNTTYSVFYESGASAKEGLVPAPPTTAGTTKYLREDGRWFTPPNTTYSAGTGLTLSGTTFSVTSTAGTSTLAWGSEVTLGTVGGLAIKAKLPANPNTDTWIALVGATSSANGTAGYVPAPPKNGYDTKYLRADGTWSILPSLKGATSSANGTAGYAPAPPKDGYNTKYLRADGTWTVPPDTNTTYTFTNKAATLAWGTTSTIATVGGTDITVTMPANPNTDTHWTSKLIAGASNSTANAATSNGSTTLRLFDNSTARNTITIKGTGATTVTSDANGVITINSTNSTTTDLIYSIARASYDHIYNNPKYYKIASVILTLNTERKNILLHVYSCMGSAIDARWLVRITPPTSISTSNVTSGNMDSQLIYDEKIGDWSANDFICICQVDDSAKTMTVSLYLKIHLAWTIVDFKPIYVTYRDLDPTSEFPLSSNGNDWILYKQTYETASTSLPSRTCMTYAVPKYTGIHYCTCSTLAAIQTKDVADKDLSSLVDGQTLIYVYFRNGNTATNPTLKVNSIDPIAIQVGDNSAASYIKAGYIYPLLYIGGVWQIICDPAPKS